MPRFARLALLAMTVAAPALLAADAKLPAGPYATDFTKMPVGKLAGDELFVLNGAFAVTEADGNKFLELPGNPVDTFGVLFGPEGQAATEVSARIAGTSAGKMFPEFGVGSNDAAGWKLWLIPAQNAVVLRKGEEERGRAKFAWTSGAWTHFRLRVAPAGDRKWTISGKVWAGGKDAAAAKEPDAWTLTTTDAAAPAAGRASAWGQPYSGTAIRFDDLSVTPPAGK